MPSLSPTQSVEGLAASMSYFITMTNVRTVSFSYTQVASNTHVLIDDPDKGTKMFSLSETNVYRPMPYIIYSYSQTYRKSYLKLLKPKAKLITPEKLIGIVFGSVGLFFIILAIIILVYNKKKEVKAFMDDDIFSTSDDEMENTETVFSG
ncbi:hypothetical protein M9Y10_038484 [Tritrichomonas musculus]|uniref:Uncharacterized protein n=1 Tax=Tritrichomonas musculus TaxID=1915356 RepID=A0ABR2K8Q4_9EUKA